MKSLKNQIIIGIILILVTTLVNCLINYGNKRIEAGTIKKYTDSVVSYKKKLNDLVDVMVSERYVFSQTLEKAKQDNSILRSRIVNDIRPRTVQSTIQTDALYTDELKMHITKVSLDSARETAEMYKVAYTDTYRTMKMLIDMRDSSATLTDSIRVPIRQIVYKSKSDYKQYHFIKRIWKRIWEVPKLRQRVWSDNPDVIIEFEELIEIQK
jgi:hypothetical protein